MKLFRDFIKMLKMRLQKLKKLWTPPKYRQIKEKNRLLIS